jgi:hypothetical protein
MKILNRQTQNGGTLITALIVCGLIGIMLVAYIAMVSSQHKFSQRSQVWNNCIPLCEAGVEEALAHLNHINTTNKFDVNGWTSNSLAFRKTRNWNGSVTRMAISNDSPPTITVMASLKAPVQSGSLTRTIRVKTKINQRFPNGILSKGGIVLGGSGKVDSFNSALPGIESDTNGQYIATKATDRATVVTVANTLNIINVGNMEIYGNIAMGPGGTASMGPTGNVGDTAYNNNPSYDGTIQPGHTTDDVNVYVPDAILPTGFGAAAILKPWPSVPTIVGGVTYKHVFDTGDYRYTLGNFNLVLLEKVLIRGNARIFIQGQTVIRDSASITIANTNASVEWYANNNVDIGGSGVINSTGLAKNFSLIGLNTCLSVIYSGTQRFVGTCYAPRADVVLTGTSDAYGAVVAKTFKLSGTMGLHYDESLKGDPRKNRFIAASWQEL